jgi:hypothetical protein
MGHVATTRMTTPSPQSPPAPLDNGYISPLSTISDAYASKLDEHHVRSLGKLIIRDLDRIADIDKLGDLTRAFDSWRQSNLRHLQPLS